MAVCLGLKGLEIRVEDFLNLSEEDIQRIAHTGPQSAHDDEVVRIVFRHLSQAPNTVGALSSYARDYVLTVAELFEFVKHAPPYLESSIQVGSFQVDSVRPEKYLLNNEFRMTDWVKTVDVPKITTNSFMLSTGGAWLYNEAIVLTVAKKYTEGYADKLKSLYGFQCVASKGGATSTGAQTLTLRVLVLALQKAVAQDPDMPVVMEFGEGRNYPVLGVCWVEEDDTVLLQFARDIE